MLYRYTGVFYAGMPAITRHRFGEGWVYYTGTSPDAAVMDAVLADAGAKAGIDLRALAHGVEEVVRGGVRFRLNHNDQSVVIG